MTKCLPAPIKHWDKFWHEYPLKENTVLELKLSNNNNSKEVHKH